MTRREYARLKLQDFCCPDDQINYHLEQLCIDDSPWRTVDDSESGGMLRHDERRAIANMVEDYSEFVAARYQFTEEAS